jgi:hypothetical protein
VIEYRIGLEYFPIVRKGDAVYLDNKVIATGNDYFSYLGSGYYQVNRDLYYLGMHLGTAPKKGVMFVHSESHYDPQPQNPNVMNCPVSKHTDILETSDGLHVENEVYDN